MQLTTVPYLSHAASNVLRGGGRHLQVEAAVGEGAHGRLHSVVTDTNYGSLGGFDDVDELAIAASVAAGHAVHLHKHTE